MKDGPPLAGGVPPKAEDRRFNPFVKQSVYRVRSLGTQNEPTVTSGLFEGFTNFGMGGEGVMMRLADDHGDDKGKLRVIPLHMVLHIDVLEQKEEDEEKQDEGHPVSYS